jgi:hypothetical protein
MTLTHPVCVWCGSPWQSLDNEPPRWCSNDGQHNCIWFYLGDEIEREVLIDERDCIVVWNCQTPGHLGKNMIREMDDYDNPTFGERIWFFDSLAYSASLDELRAIVNRSPDE